MQVPDAIELPICALLRPPLYALAILLGGFVPITAAATGSLFVGEPEVVAGATWLEGISATADGTLYFSDVRGNRLLKLSPGKELSVFRSPSNYSNGTVIDAEGRLIVCEEGDPAAGLPPRVTRTNLRTNAVEVLIDRFGGKRLLGPNDVRIDRTGRVYFTDGSRPSFLPPYNNTPGSSGPVEPTSTTGVYRIDIEGAVRQILAPPMIRQPNGLGIAPDMRTFYVIENDPAADGLRQLLAFDIRQDGSLTNRRVLHDFSPGRSGDGMIVDAQGNLWVAAGLNRLRGTSETLATRAGIYVFSPAGQQLDFAPIPEDTVTNLTFSRACPAALYVTAGKTVFTLETSAQSGRKKEVPVSH
jgi:gluconolactonase